MTRRTGRETALVEETERPVPLEFSWSLEPLHELLEELVRADRAPVYVVFFTQASALERAQALVSAKLCTREERAAIADAIGGFRFTAGFGRTLSRLIRSGIGVHHAGMLPRYRRLWSSCPKRAAEGDLRDRHVGRRHQRPDPHRGFHRVGQVRRFAAADLEGARVPPDRRARRARGIRRARLCGGAGSEHAIERARAAAKAGDDPKKLRKLQRSKPADGVVGWTEETFERLRNATRRRSCRGWRQPLCDSNVINQPADQLRRCAR